MAISSTRAGHFAHQTSLLDFCLVLCEFLAMGRVQFSDIARRDALLAEDKILTGPAPKWRMMQNGRFDASWPVAGLDGAVMATLNFRLDPRYRDFPNVSLIYENLPVCRLDLAPETMVKPNPPWALGAEPSVKGNHFHTWADNKDRILATNNWTLQCRRQAPNAIRRVPQMLRSFAAHINLQLEGDQHGFDFVSDDLLGSG